MAFFVSRNELLDRLLVPQCCGQKGGTLGCVGNQQKWHTLRPERSGVLWRSCKLPDFPVVLSSPFNGLSLYLPSAL